MNQQAGTAAARPRNRILAAIPNDEYTRLGPHLEPIKLEVRDLVIDVNESITHVYFLDTGVVSIIGLMADRSPVETATIGFEGMVGLAVFHKTDRIAAQAFCQVPAEGLRMSVVAFRAELERAPALTTLLHRYTQAMFTQVAQASACNRVHPARRRCARWLLQTHDRVGTDEFPLTHEFLAQMLGVRRATVSEVAAALQRERLLEYRYGRITITDRAALERASCECYGIIAAEYARLIDGKMVRSPLDGIVASDHGKSTVGSPDAHGDELE